MNNNYESHAISRRSFLKASGVVGAAGILAPAAATLAAAPPPLPLVLPALPTPLALPR